MIVRLHILFLFFVVSQSFGSIAPIGSNYVNTMKLSELPLEQTQGDSVHMVPYTGGVLPVTLDTKGKVSGGTFKLELSVTVDSLLVSPTLYIAPSPYPITVYQDGDELYHWGALNNTNTLANFHAESVRLIPVEAGKTLNLTIYLYTDGASIIVPNLFVIDNARSVERKVFWITLFNHDIIVGIVITSALLSLLLIMAFLIDKRHRLDMLLLGFVGLSIVASYIIFVFNAPFFPGVILYKIARIGNILLPITLFFFVLNYSQFSSKKYGLYSLAISVVLISSPFISIIEASTKYEVNTILNQVMNSTLMPIMILTTTLLLSMTVLSKNRIRSILLLLFYLFFLVAGVRDAENLTSFIQPEVWRIPYGFAVAFFGYAFSIIYTIAVNANSSYRTINELEKSYDQLLYRKSKGEFSSKEFTRSLYRSIIEKEHPIAGIGGRIATMVEVAQMQQEILLDTYRVWYDRINTQQIFSSMVTLFEESCKEEEIQFLSEANIASLPPYIWSDERSVRLLFFSCHEALINSTSPETIEFSLTANNSTLDCRFFSTGFLSEYSFGITLDEFRENGGHLEESPLAFSDAMIYTLIDELDGSIEISRKNGTMIHVTIPIKQIK